MQLLPLLLRAAGLASLLGVAYLQFRIMRQRLTINRRTLIVFVSCVVGSVGFVALVDPRPSLLLVLSGVLIPGFMIIALSIWIRDRIIVSRVPVYMARARKFRMKGPIWMAEGWERYIQWLCDRYVEAEALRSKQDE